MRPWQIEWPTSDYKGLARYVVPTMAQAAAQLSLSVSSFDLNQQQGDGRLKLLEALYTALREHQPPIYYDYETYHPHESQQIIRPPNEILDGSRRGTCLDLALMFSSLCLHFDLLPLVVLVSDDQLGSHALVAVSLKHSLRDWDHIGRSEFDKFGVISDADTFQSLLDSNRYVLVECTGFTYTESTLRGPEGIGRVDGFLPFEGALVAGKTQMSQRQLVTALDVYTLQQTFGFIAYNETLTLAMILKEIQKLNGVLEDITNDQVQKELKEHISDLALEIGSSTNINLSDGGTIVMGDVHAGTFIGRDQNNVESQETINPIYDIYDPPPYYQASEVSNQLIDLLKGQNPPARLVIFGMVGVGKSELANYISRELGPEQFAHGIIKIDLSSKHLGTDLDHIAGEYGQGDNIARLTDVEVKAKALRNFLSDKNVLLIIDQADSNWNILEILTPPKSDIPIIITIREKPDIELQMESEYLQPFSFEETVAFFQAKFSADQLKDAESGIRETHNLLGGVPLLIDLAASLMVPPDFFFQEYNKLLQVEDQLSGFQDFIAEWGDKVKGGELAKFIQAFQLSFDQLTPNQQSLFTQSSIFEGQSFGAEALAAITGLNQGLIKTRGLEVLKDKSLIYQPTGIEDRFAINPVTKSFARQKLTATVFDDSSLKAASYFSQLATESDPADGYKSLTHDWDNVTHFIRWSIENGYGELAVQGATGLVQPYLGVMGFLDQRGYWSEARQLLAEIEPIASGLDNPISILTTIVCSAGFALHQNDLDLAKNYLAQTSELLTSTVVTDDNIAIVLHYYALESRASRQSDLGKALDYLNTGLEILENDSLTIDTAPHRGFILSQQSTLLAMSGRLDDASAAARKALEELPQWPSEAKLVCLNNLGGIALHLSQPNTCLKYAQLGIKAARQTGNVNRLVSYWNISAYSLIKLGQLSKAKRNVITAYHHAKRIGNSHYQSGFLVNLAKIYIAVGKYDDALKLLNQALSIAKPHRFIDIAVTAYSNMIDLFLETERIEQAEAVLKPALVACGSLGFYLLLPTLLRQQAQITQRLGNYELADSELVEAFEAAEKFNDPAETGVCHRLRGIGLGASGNEQEALNEFNKSLSILEDTDRVEWARTQRVFADFLRQSGDLEAAAGAKAAARGILSF